MNAVNMADQARKALSDLEKDYPVIRVWVGKEIGKPLSVRILRAGWADQEDDYRVMLRASIALTAAGINDKDVQMSVESQHPVTGTSTVRAKIARLFRSATDRRKALPRQEGAPTGR